jgi:hypothetical protein
MVKLTCAKLIDMKILERTFTNEKYEDDRVAFTDEFRGHLYKSNQDQKPPNLDTMISTLLRHLSSTQQDPGGYLRGLQYSDKLDIYDMSEMILDLLRDLDKPGLNYREANK